MGRLKQKGKAGAAKAYVTRSSAVKKLQCSLADFRRLCILKGIFPREPKNKKRANKGSTAPKTFYYAKDIAYLVHEPVLQKLREHKAFAKKISRALGRGEWSIAKSLEENKPTYRLDHIIKERYPTFIDALRDIDDALCMISLFASLPSNPRISPALIANCTRLTAEWQLYVMRTHALRKVFLSIKGIYYQAEVMDQTITWLVPYQFTQSIPLDVDVRVMLTFLELYQTLLGFVFFKLYADSGLSYPPVLDEAKDDTGAGVGAFTLKLVEDTVPITTSESTSPVKKVTGKEVRRALKDIAAISEKVEEAMEVSTPAEPADSAGADEDFIVQPSKTKSQTFSELPTFHSLELAPRQTSTNLFAPYTFFLSRETSRTVFEFIVRSFGGQIGWPRSSGSGSPISEDDASITHVIIDRPLLSKPNETVEERERRMKRKYVQPQWIVDCINTGKILLEEPYAQGKILPPHLSPFGDRVRAYDPAAPLPTTEVDEGAEMEEEEEADREEMGTDGDDARINLTSIMAEDPETLRAAELQAEAAGLDYVTFDKQIKKSQKQSEAKLHVSHADEDEQNMNKMMMSNRQKKLYERMKYGERKRAAQNAALEEKRRQLVKEKKS